MNDPNGCIYHNGEYHLYFQYHPYSTQWGPMHWGHAVSPDLLHWQELQIALEPDDELGMAFSGSAVIDENGRINAIYTGHTVHGSEQRQHQCIAVSEDDGRSFHVCDDNPIIPSAGRADFRDPKVFYHQESESWVMIISCGNGFEIYRSADLHRWHLASGSTLKGALKDGIYECPDLQCLQVFGSESSVWMVSMSFLNEHTASAGVTLCAFGSFDGYRFIQEQSAQIIDHGFDFYAMQSWNDMPGQRHVWIGWINHWKYANLTPTTPWRGCMSLPRELSVLQDAAGEYRLLQRPVSGFEDLIDQTDVYRGDDPVLAQGVDGSGSMRICIEGYAPEGRGSMTLKLYDDQEDLVTISLDGERGTLTLDRSRASCNQFDRHFLPEVSVQLESQLLPADLEIVVDRSVIEIFACRGAVVMTNLFFMKGMLSSMTLEQSSPSCSSVRISQLHSIWEDKICD